MGKNYKKQIIIDSYNVYVDLSSLAKEVCYKKNQDKLILRHKQLKDSIKTLAYTMG